MVDRTNAQLARICVTGANGYLGGVICEALEARGLPAVPLARSTGFDLGRPPSADWFASQGVTSLIHCAHDFSPLTWAQASRVNVDGSVALMESALAGGARTLVFVSSLSAHDHCRSHYGRAKRAVERFVMRSGGAAVRPGTIWGPRPGGLMRNLIERVRTSRVVIPVITHPGPIHLAYDEDVSRLLIDLAIGATPAGATPWFAASDQAWTLREIVVELARRTNATVRPIGLPWPPAWAVARLIEALGFRPAFRSDSLVSLGYPALSAEIATLQRPSFDFRPFS